VGLGWRGLRLIVTLNLGLEARVSDVEVLVVGWRLGLVLRPSSANQ
jgi:hypothetical protein